MPPVRPVRETFASYGSRERILWERSISPAPRCILHGQLCAFAGYLCTVSRPSPLGPSPSVLVLVCPAFLVQTTMPHLTACKGLGDFGTGLPSLLPTLLAIPFRLSRVQPGGLKQDDVGGVLLAAPSALCGSPVPAQGKQVRLCLLPRGVQTMGRTLLPRQELGFRMDWLAS